MAIVTENRFSLYFRSYIFWYHILNMPLIWHSLGQMISLRCTSTHIYILFSINRQHYRSCFMTLLLWTWQRAVSTVLWQCTTKPEEKEQIHIHLKYLNDLQGQYKALAQSQLCSLMKTSIWIHLYGPVYAYLDVFINVYFFSIWTFRLWGLAT